jgi:hypothetical protein
MPHFDRECEKHKNTVVIYGDEYRECPFCALENRFVHLSRQYEQLLDEREFAEDKTKE